MGSSGERRKSESSDDVRRDPGVTWHAHTTLRAFCNRRPRLSGLSPSATAIIGSHADRVGGLHSPKQLDLKQKKKKARTTFTGRQIFELEKQFEVKKYLSSSERAELAKLLNVTETQVCTFRPWNTAPGFRLTA